MQKKHIPTLNEALKAVSIHTLDKADQYAVIDNIVALTDELELLEKSEREAIEKFKPKNFDTLEGGDKEAAVRKLNADFTDYITPKLDEPFAGQISKLSDAAMEAIYAQKEVSTGQKAVIRKFLKQ